MEKMRKTLVGLALWAIIASVLILGATPRAYAVNWCAKVDIQGPYKKSTQRLFGADYIDGALKISSDGTSPTFTAIENKILPTIFSKRGLRELIKVPGAPQELVKMLVRIGAIRADALDPYYPELILAADNLPVNLLGPHDDPAVEKFLEVKNYLKRAEERGEERTLPKAYEKERNDFIYWKALKALDKIQDEDERSRDAIVATFTEIARIGEDGRRYTPEQRLEKIKLLLDATNLKGKTVVIPAEIRLREVIQGGIAEVPPMGLVSTVVQKLANLVARRDRQIKTETVDAGNVDRRTNPVAKLILENDLKEEVPGSYRVGFFQRDPLNLQKPALDFIAKYTDRTQNVSLFSVQFADEMEAAYDELRTVRNRPGVEDLAVGIQGQYVDEGPFGPGTYEGYKVMSRAALTMAMIRGDSEYFPHITTDEFNSLRQGFLTDLGFLQDGKLSAKAIDSYFVFLLLDTLGRGKSELLDAMEAEHKFIAQIGPDYERRSLAILKKYRLASHSFARLDDDEQAKIIHRYEFIYLYNSGQIIRLEGGRESFQHFTDAHEGDAAALLYRSFLGFSALPGSAREMGSSTLTSVTLKQWLAFRSGLFSLMKEGKTAAEAYDRYIQWVAQQVHLPLALDDLKQFTVIRLVGQAQAVDSPEKAQQISAQFDELTPEEQEILITFQSKYPVLNYGSAALMVKTASKNSSLVAYKGKPYLLAMKILARIYQRIASTSEFK